MLNQLNLLKVKSVRETSKLNTLLLKMDCMSIICDWEPLPRMKERHSAKEQARMIGQYLSLSRAIN